MIFTSAAHKLARPAWWEAAVLLACGAVGVWLTGPALGWAAVAAVFSAHALIVGLVHRARGLLVAAGAMVASLVAIHTSWRVREAETAWPERREELITAASRTLDEQLFSSVELARALADSAVELVNAPPTDGFRRLAAAGDHRGVEWAAVLLDSLGEARVWAGRNRLAAEPMGPELEARITPFYALLEARRQEGAYTGVGRVLLAAASSVPDREHSLALRFRRQTGATLQFYSPEDAPTTGDVFDYTLETDGRLDTLFSVRTMPPDQGTYKLDQLESGGRTVSLSVVATLVLLMLLGGPFARWVALGGVVGLVILTPAGADLELGQWFSSATYYLERLGPFSTSAGSLLVSASVVMAAVSSLSRRGLPRHPVGLAAGVLLVLLAPFAMAFLASGITPPTGTIGLGLWLSWETALAVSGACVLLLAAVLVRGSDNRVAPPWVPWAAGVWALGCGLLGLMIWNPVIRWPAWYATLWLPAAVLAILPSPRLRLLLTVTVVSGAGAAALSWDAVVHHRLLLAERDATRVSGGDPFARGLLDEFGEQLLRGQVPGSAASLYAAWRESSLSSDDFPAVLATWDPNGQLVARLDLAQLELREGLLAALAATARDTSRVQREEGVPTRVAEPTRIVGPPSLFVLSVPFDDGSVVTVGVGPRSRLIEPARLGRFLRGERRIIAPYEMRLGEALPTVEEKEEPITWYRDGWALHGTGALRPSPEIRNRVHFEVPLGGIGRQLVRGSLLVFWDALVIGCLWLLGGVLSGSLSMPPGARELVRLRSYRTRLTIALAGFFILPTLAYAAWSIARLRTDAARSGDLLIRQSLADAATTARDFQVRWADLRREDSERADEYLRTSLTNLAEGLNADLVWYDGGLLLQASPAALAELGLLDRYMPAEVFVTLTQADEMEFAADAAIGGQATRVGYRSLVGPEGSGPILAAPRLVDMENLASEREDLLFGLLLATLVGLTSAAWLAAAAARSLAQPVRSLRGAALTVARGEPLPPFEHEAPTEFVPVFEAFQRMAHDVKASQSALEAARRRTATVLRNVATGVVAVDRTLRVTIANPRATDLLGVRLTPQEPVDRSTAAEWAPVWAWVRQFLGQEADADTREFTIGGRQIRAQVAAIHGSPGGCVVALDDTTDLARAVRVLAWGELARQVAHEIKNPLTPIRLGIQHLKRAYDDRGEGFDAVLDRTGRQILAEIERLDAIARAFARFGAPPAEAAPLAHDDLSAIALDTAELYSLADGTAVRVHQDGPVVACVRKDEVKEVLVNLVENARDAGATEVGITVGKDDAGRAVMVVSDDGAGIPTADVPHVFEPHFSTTTSGTGLGLAICRRLVESWGGQIRVESEEGRGTTIRIAIPPDSSRC